MRIQHNIMAMNAYRNYNTNTSALSKNLEKLSSGYKINRAGDDAAGLAISEKMRAQITGLNAAQKNVKDGISLVKTAEGAMQEIQDMLNRMDYLATQSANGTYDDPVDRANLQKEVNALRSEIDRIADSANFNGIQLLDGTQGGKQVTEGAVEATPAAFTPTLDATKNKDGQRPTQATKSAFTITTGAANKTFKDAGSTPAAVTVGTSKWEDIKVEVDGTEVKLTDLYKVKDDTGADVGAGTVIAAGKTFTLEAKSGGARSEVEAWADLLTGAAGDYEGATGEVTTPGQDEGAGTPATKTEYTLEFNFANLVGGQTFKIGDKTFEISTDGGALSDANNVKIDLSGIDLSVAGTGIADGQGLAAKKIHDAISGETDLVDTGDGKFAISDAPTTAAPGVTDGKYKVTLTGNTAGDDATNLGNVRVSESDADKAGITSTYTASLKEGPGKTGKFAEITYSDFDISKLEEGHSLTIGGYTVKVVSDDKDPVQENPTNKTVEIKESDAQDADKLVAAFERAGFLKGKLDINTTDKTLHITDATDVGRTAAQLAADVGVTLTDPNASAGAAGTTKSVGGLTLQIGDTSKPYNQLSVIIGDMHVKSMGTTYTVSSDENGKEVRTDNMVDGKLSVVGDKSIEKIDISTQEGASAAIDVIRDAINYVSSIRGDLGAVQNRLEHTANNLSVMAENIQDAESTIRDTDVAEEMMAYTKNNILVQSAQAMLAQANAVPQGVLQLLG